MENKQANPLSAYFRAPKLFTSIPSGGQGYTPDIVEMPETGELPIFAMTSKDELIMRNPDALLNGEAVTQVIQSCVPNVKNARKMLSVDIDILLIAIQGATYGDDIEVSAECPKCTNKTTAIASVDTALATMGTVDGNYQVEENGLTIEVKPFNYSSTIKAGITNFKSTRSLQALAEIPDEMERLAMFNQNFKEIALLNTELVTDSVASIRAKDPDGNEIVVTDRQQILEFLDNADSSIGKLIENQIGEINNQGVNLEMELECEFEDCVKNNNGIPHKFSSKVNFDPVNFSMAS
jgi:hypothetical protein